MNDLVDIKSIDRARSEPMDEYDSVITVCQDSIEDHIPENVDYHFFNMADGPDSGDGYGGRYDYTIFEESAETLLDKLKNGESVMIHCHMGQSRSVAVSIAALAVHTNESYHEVYTIIEDDRPQIHPNELLKEHAIRFIEDRTNISHKPFDENL